MTFFVPITRVVLAPTFIISHRQKGNIVEIFFFFASLTADVANNFAIKKNGLSLFSFRKAAYEKARIPHISYSWEAVGRHIRGKSPTTAMAFCLCLGIILLTVRL